MNVDPVSSPKWLCDMHRELLRGRQVLLYGNVSDEFLVDTEQGSYVTLAEYLHRYFVEEGFQIVGRYDLVDGFVWAEPARMGPLVQQVLTGRAPAPAVTEAAVEPVSGAPRGAAPGLSRRLADQPARPGLNPALASSSGGPTYAAVPIGTGEPVALDRALRDTRLLVRHPHIATALTICFSDRLVSDPQHQSAQELPALILLRKVIEEAAVIESGTLRNRRNCCVLVADRLEGVPGWLYQENPLLALVHVNRPSPRERTEFARRSLSRVHGVDETVSSETQEQLVREFSDLTDGLTSRDLRAVLRTSVMEQLPATRMKALIDRYRYGQRDDPWEKIDATRIRAARGDLASQVIGQGGAIEAVVEMLVAARVGLSLTPSARSGRPKGVFFFVGPTGVGKTELAKALTKLIFSDEGAYARFDMSEYALEHASEKLTGSPPGYVGFGEGGQLTNRVIERPFSLLLFDEIEKAHPRIMDKFLQVLDDGRLTDSRGQTADFSQSVIIFTSNTGSDTMMSLISRSLSGSSASPKLPEYEEIRKHYRQAVSQHFSAPAPQGLGRPEILNRLGDNVLVFDILRPDYIADIARKFIRALVDSAQERQGLRLQFVGDEVPQLVRDLMMADPANLKMGGRQVRTLTETCVLKPISQFLFEQNITRGSTLAVHADAANRSVRIERTT